AYVDDKVSELRKQLPGAPEIKLLVFAALLLADESHEARGIAKAAESARASATDSAETLATALEDLITSRVDKMSQKVTGAACPVFASTLSRLPVPRFFAFAHVPLPR